MARKAKPNKGSDKGGRKPSRLASADFKVDLDKPNPSPLDFINRRMAEMDGEGE
jgi:hypothetical protein